MKFLQVKDFGFAKLYPDSFCIYAGIKDKKQKFYSLRDNSLSCQILQFDFFNYTTLNNHLKTHNINIFSQLFYHKERC